MNTVTQSFPNFHNHTRALSKAEKAFAAVLLFRACPDRKLQLVRRIDASTFRAVQTASAARAMIEAEIALLERSATDNWHLSIPPLEPCGFAIDLSCLDGRYRCLFGELEEEFETLDAALRWVARALSTDYRLRITYSGGRGCEWKLEPIVNSGAIDALAMGHFSILDLFRPKSTTIRSNSFAPVGAAYRAVREELKSASWSSREP